MTNETNQSSTGMAVAAAILGALVLFSLVLVEGSVRWILVVLLGAAAAVCLTSALRGTQRGAR